MDDKWARENGMVLDALWEYTADGKDTGQNPYRSHECDRCGSYIYEDDDSHRLEDERLCNECWERHCEIVEEEE